MLEKQDHLRNHDNVSSKNGTDRHLRAGCHVLRDHDGQHRGAVTPLRDITEKTLIEQRLRRMERYIGLGSLATGLQHEIKNPLGALLLHVQLLQESLQQQETTSAVQESLGVLAMEVRRITGVLESFRDYASVAQLNLAATDLRALIEKLITLTEPQARRQKVDITAVFPDADGPRLLVDAMRIEQVLLNLLLNALAAMADGGTVTIRLRVRRNSIEIDIADTGCGIPDDLHDRVFDPYFTTHSTGTGMGLALCEKIVRQHAGAIEFTSGIEGTVFTVSLPRNATP